MYGSSNFVWMNIVFSFILFITEALMENHCNLFFRLQNMFLVFLIQKIWKVRSVGNFVITCRITYRDNSCNLQRSSLSPSGPRSQKPSICGSCRPPGHQGLNYRSQSLCSSSWSPQTTSWRGGDGTDCVDVTLKHLRPGACHKQWNCYVILLYKTVI